MTSAGCEPRSSVSTPNPRALSPAQRSVVIAALADALLEDYLADQREPIEARDVTTKAGAR